MSTIRNALLERAVDLRRDVLRDLHDLELISAPGRGVTRLGYTTWDSNARTWFEERAATAGLHFRVDRYGNTYGATPAAATSRSVLVGSHLDSVFNAGPYDGALGVVASLHLAAESWREDPGVALTVVSFACEESTQFGFGSIGSHALAGVLDGDALAALRNRDGASLGSLLSQAGLADLPDESGQLANRYSCFVELHIDQGTLLTNAGARVGLVTQIAGIVRLQVAFEGEASHSGARRRSDRRDAVVAAARFITDINDHWARVDPAGTRVQLTVGQMNVHPNSPNTVPGRAVLIVDIRSGSDDALDGFTEDIKHIASTSASSVGVEMSELEHTMPLKMDPGVMEVLATAADELGIETHPCISLAGHDAQIVGRVIPTAMLLLANPSGLSHSPAESVDHEAIAEALAICLLALPRLSRSVAGWDATLARGA